MDHRPDARYGWAQHSRDGYYDRYDRYDGPDRGRSPPPWRRNPSTLHDDRNGYGYTFRGAASSRDYYRPEDNFTFQARGPPAPRFPSPVRHASSTQPPKPRPRRDQGNRRPRGQQSNRVYGGRGRGGFKPPPAHTRDILHNTQRASTPEQLHGMNNDHQVRFTDIQSSSDEDGDDDNAVGVTQDSDLEDGEVPRKRVKTVAHATAQSAKTKWSNPDPYTSLPPPETLGAPKKDIVKAIRKAKIESGPRTDSTNAVKDNDDFIIFDFGDDLADAEMSDGTESGSENKPPINAPVAPANPRDSEMANRNNTQFLVGADAQQTQTRASNTANDWIDVPPPPPPSPPPPPPPPPGLILPTNEELVAHYVGDAKGKKRKRNQQSTGQGEIKDEWKSNGTDPTPWCTVDHSHSASLGLRLHKEICEFHDFVRPYDYEEAVRRDLVKRIQNTIQKRGGPAREVEIHSFGSFAAGLYLPTADMDLVAVSPMFLRTGVASYCQTPNKIHALARYLENAGVAVRGTVSPVTKAKVPLVKFIDRRTGIKVDMSFENMSGLWANNTFHAWKAKFPAMPVLVVLVKQMLAMRGLNEVFTGGLGGFSIICLVVSMMQMMPEIQSGAMDPLQHYNDLLMNFLDLYGNKFDIRTTGIEMNPPGYYDKIRNPRGMQNPQTLTIIDPNRPENDISGGSRNINAVLDCFRTAHSEIQRRLAQLASGHDIGGSILGRVLGGNYSSFTHQRNNLSLVHRDYIAQFASLAGPPAVAPATRQRNDLSLVHRADAVNTPFAPPAVAPAIHQRNDLSLVPRDDNPNTPFVPSKGAPATRRPEI